MAEPDIDNDILLDCALAHTAENLRAYLKQEGLPTSGAKDVLRQRLEEHLAGGGHNALRLTEHLNRIDGWGNQHVYLYKSAPQLLPRWRDEKKVRTILKDGRALGLFNRARPVVLPDKPRLASVGWSPSRIRFVWNEKREWFERREDEDVEEDNLVLRAWERKTNRGTLAFDWDLTTGHAMVMIQRLPSGTRYAEVRDRVQAWLERFVDLATFDRLRLGPAIKRILDSGEVRERKTNWETLQGGRASFQSPSRKQGVDNDETLKRMEAEGRDDMQGSLGNMYWLPNGSALQDELHTALHKKDQRVSIMGERTEEEVRYVIGRIGEHCS